MNIYVVRHADAERVGGQIQRDADRPLSARGEDDARAVGEMLARLDPQVGTIVTSPLLRARQTGDILGKALLKRPVIRSSELLAPGFRPRDLFDELLRLGTGGSIIAVGHQPDVGAFVSSLIAGESDANIAMSPGTVARLRVTPTGSPTDVVLEWLLTPDVARGIR